MLYNNLFFVFFRSRRELGKSHALLSPTASERGASVRQMHLQHSLLLSQKNLSATHSALARLSLNGILRITEWVVYYAPSHTLSYSSQCYLAIPTFLLLYIAFYTVSVHSAAPLLRVVFPLHYEDWIVNTGRVWPSTCHFNTYYKYLILLLNTISIIVFSKLISMSKTFLRVFINIRRYYHLHT